MNFTNKSYLRYMFVFLLILSSIVFTSCSLLSYEDETPITLVEIKPGRSLGIDSVLNLRDMGGFKTTSGATVASGLVYRSNELYNISASDMLLLTQLNLKTVFDFRTEAERAARPDELADGVNYVSLDVQADDPSAGIGDLSVLLADAQKANDTLGGGKIEEKFKEAYRQSVTLPSAKIAYRKLFLALADEKQLPAIFHCASGKDRTGWAAAALLSILGVAEEAIVENYLLSNEYVLGQYDEVIKKFLEDGGHPSIPTATLGVKEEYLAAAFDEMYMQYGSIENYFSEGLGIDTDQQTALRNIYLNR